MDNIEYRPNSHKSKEESAQAEEQKKVEKVVQGSVKTKKKSEMSKLASVFISEDAKNVKNYVFMDVVVPAIKNAIVDVVTDGINMIINGGTGRRRGSSGGSKVSYRSYFDQRDGGRSPDRAPAPSRFDYDDLVFETRGDAEMVREQLDEIIDRYGHTTVADYYEAANMTAPYTANNYGWFDIRGAEPIRLRSGEYTLKLPRAVPIK